MGNLAVKGVHQKYRAETQRLYAGQAEIHQEIIRTSAQMAISELMQEETLEEVGQYPDSVLRSIAERAASYALELTRPSERQGE